MTSTIMPEQEQAIAAFLDGRTIVSGLGTAAAACSVASINLALTGRLTDEIPDCMSQVIGRWIIRVQDAMPAEMRNSGEWRRLLPLAAGTGREHERERRDLVLDWMWGVLSILQPLADRQGFGDPWRLMCELRTAEAAYEAGQAALDADSAYVIAAIAADAEAAYRAADSAAHAEAAYRAAETAAAADARDADAGIWRKTDPVGLLGRLVAVSAGRPRYEKARDALNAAVHTKKPFACNHIGPIYTGDDKH